MKSFTLLLPVLAALATAGKVDECAGSCISDAIASTGCASSDSLCICGSNSFLESVESCTSCVEDGINAAVGLAQDYCETVSHTGLKRSTEWDGHSYGWWQKEWRKVRAGNKDGETGGDSTPPTYSPPVAPTTPKTEHPIEDWFSAHPNYLINHPGWLSNHPNWAVKHNDFLKTHLPKDSPYWGGKPPHNPPHGYPQPPPQPHKTYTGKPHPTTTCTDKKPSPTVYDYYN